MKTTHSFALSKDNISIRIFEIDAKPFGASEIILEIEYRTSIILYISDLKGLSPKSGGRRRVNSGGRGLDRLTEVKKRNGLTRRVPFPPRSACRQLLPPGRFRGKEKRL